MPKVSLRTFETVGVVHEVENKSEDGETVVRAMNTFDFVLALDKDNVVPYVAETNRRGSHLNRGLQWPTAANASAQLPFSNLCALEIVKEIRVSESFSANRAEHGGKWGNDPRGHGNVWFQGNCTLEIRVFRNG